MRNSDPLGLNKKIKKNYFKTKMCPFFLNVS